MATSTDSEYIDRLCNGDKQALYVLYDRYGGALYGVILRMCRDEQRAQDLLQETFIKIWENISTFNSEKGKFYTWANRIARNTTLNYLRKKDKFIQTDDFSVYESTNEGETIPDYDSLKGALTTLEEHHRKAIELVYYRGMTHREAHKVMEVPLGTFKSYIRQAIKGLRAVYKR